MFFKAKTYTTVDIGTFAIKVARIKKTKNDLELVATGYRKLSQNTIKEDKINDLAYVTEQLKELFQEMNYKPKYIISTIPSNNVIVRNVELPPMEKGEIAEAIKWEAEDYLPFPVEQAALDFIVLEQTEENVKLLLIATRKKVVDEFLTPLNQLNMTPKVVNVQPLALISLLEFNGNSKEPLAVIDIGASGTRVVIGDSNNIYLSRSIDTGGEAFTQLLMDEMKMGFQEAEEYKLEYGLMEELGEGEMDDNLGLSQFGGNNILTPLARQLANEISRSLDYYAMKYRGETVSNVYLTGGGARLKKLADIISRETNQDLKTIDPFTNVMKSSADQSLKDEFSVAIGLGLSEVLADAK